MKPHNVLIDPATLSVKLIDFGLARPFETQPTPMSCSCGTKFFLPPEMMLGLVSYNLKSDVWAVGLIMSQMFSNKYIFPCRENEEGLLKIF
jgi:serine/threonine protein kinase